MLLLIIIVLFACIIWIARIQGDFDNFKSEQEKEKKSLEKKLFSFRNDFLKLKKAIKNNGINIQLDEPKILQKEDNTEEKIIAPLKDDIQHIKKENKIEFSTPILKEKEKTTEKAKEICDQEEYKSDFEKMFFGNLFNKIGAVALVIAFGIFIKFISQYITFTPEMKVSFGFIAGLAFVGASWKIHKDEMKAFAEVLLGVGLAVLFISTYCATTLFSLFSLPVALIIASVLLVATYFIADKYKSYSALVIGLIGGYMNPFFITHDLTPNFLFGYLIFLNAISVVYVYKNYDKKWLNFFNLIFSFILLMFNSLFSGAEHYSIAYPITLWVLYLSFDILCIANEKMSSDKEHYFSTYLNFAVLTLLSWGIFSSDRTAFGILLLIYGIIYAILTTYFLMNEQRKILRPFLYSLLAIVYMSTFFLSEGFVRVMLWAFEALALTSLRYRLNLKYFSNWALFFTLTCVVSLFRVNYSFNFVENYVPVFNMRTLIFGIPALTIFYSSYLLGKTDREKDIHMSMFFKFLSFTLMYLYVGFEMNNFYISRLGYEDSVDGLFMTVKNMSNIILGFIYAMNMKFLSERNKSVLYNLLSYTVWGICILFMLTLGWHYYPVDTYLPVLNVRFLAFAIGITTALIYAKLSKQSLFKYIAVFLGFLLISCETSDYLIRYGLYENTGFVITIAWLLYLGVISLFGIAFDIKCLKNSAIWISILSILKIIFFDIAGSDMIFKVMVFAALGLILMAVSYLYTKDKMSK